MGIAIAERMPFQGYYLERPKLVEDNLLSKHIEYFRKNWRQEGLPMNWADLPGTGFMINKQTDIIFSKVKPDDNLFSKKEKIREGLSQTDQDIKGFILEYLAEGLVFPIHYKINSDGELIDSNYGNKKVKDIISSEERNGVVKDTFSKKIEPFLANSQDGSLAVMTSPSGWSGLCQEDGKPITFLDSQTYIWQKKGSDVLGFTVRTDFSNKEHREILRRLWDEEDRLPANASLVDYVANPVLIDAKENENIKEIKDVVDIMRDTRHDEVFGSLLAYKNRLWLEVYRDLERREELWKFDEVTQEMVQEFKDYVLTHEFSRANIKEALAATILRIAKFLREGKKENRIVISDPVEIPIGRGIVLSDLEIDYYGGSRYPQTRPLEKRFGYGDTLIEVQKLPGCAGGGNKNGTSLINSVTPRFGKASLELDDDEEEGFSCPRCPFKTNMPVGNKCPGCGLRKEEYAEESGEPVCG